MKGIIDQAMQPKQAAQPQRRAISPESQRIVIAAKKIMAQPQIAQQIVQMMKSSPDPATGIAQATIFLMKQLYEKSKGTMPTKAIVPAAQEILVDIMRLGQSAGLFKITPELVKQAVQLAIQMFTQSVKAQQPAAAEPPAAGATPMAPAGQPAAPIMGV